MNAASETTPAHGDAGREASAWLVRLDDAPLDEALRAAFERWLAQGPACQQAWEETRRIAALLDHLAPAHAQALPRPAGLPRPATKARTPNLPRTAAVGAVGRSSAHRPRPTRWPRRSMAACALAACIALTGLAAPQALLHLQADAMTTTATTHIVRLEDGSRVHLAPESAIAIAMGPDNRHVRLLRGEAWFDVHHDPARPFEVEAGRDRITVLGTAFDVRRGANGIDVAVARGRVAVQLADKPPLTPLAAGEALSINSDGLQRGLVRPDRVASWRAGRAIVEDRPVATLIDRLRPWYGGYIVARGPGLERRRITGVFDLRHPDRALDALSRLDAIRVTRATPWLRIVTVR